MSWTEDHSSPQSSQDCLRASSVKPAFPVRAAGRVRRLLSYADLLVLMWFRNVIKRLGATRRVPHCAAALWAGGGGHRAAARTPPRSRWRGSRADRGVAATTGPLWRAARAALICFDLTVAGYQQRVCHETCPAALLPLLVPVKPA